MQEEYEQVVDLLRRLWQEMEYEIGCAGLDTEVKAVLDAVCAPGEGSGDGGCPMCDFQPADGLDSEAARTSVAFHVNVEHPRGVDA